MNVLITSAGRRVSLITYFQKEAKRLLGKHAKVFTTDLKPELSSACRISDKSFAVGRFADNDYMDVLLHICIQHQVAIVIPTIDPELQLYAEHRVAFAEKGVHLMVSDPDFVRICRNKNLTNDFFANRNFLIPKSIDIKKPSFPLFVKPKDGSSSKNIMLIKDASMLSDFIIHNPNFMYMEYLSPKDYKEYTVDLYFDVNSNLKCVVPRIRMAVRGGETNKGITQKNELIDFLRTNLGYIEGARGCLTLQLFYGIENKQIYGIEINPRFGGGYPLSYLAGANYPAWLLQEYLQGKTIEWFDDWEDKLLLLRYDYEMVVYGFDNI